MRQLIRRLGLSALVLSMLALPARAADVSFTNPLPHGPVDFARPSLAVHLFTTAAPGSIQFRLSLDGQPVSAALDPKTLMISYTPPQPLSPGVHQASLNLTVDGQQYQPVDWSFTVLPDALTALPPPTAQQQAALQWVNRYRAIAGLPPLKLNDSLDMAAQQQADFFVQHIALYYPGGLSPHQQPPGNQGVYPWQRDHYFGYPGDRSAEVMDSVSDPRQATADWIDSVYHRIPLLTPQISLMGFGAASLPGSQPYPGAAYIDFGYLGSPPAPPDQTVLYPVPGQMGVPTTFQAGETPDPLKAFGGASLYPVGFPVTLNFPSSQVTGITVSSATLTTAAGVQVPSYVLTPANDPNDTPPNYELGNTVSIMAQAPLSPDTVYQVHISGTYTDAQGTQPFSYAWPFSTAPAPTHLTPAPYIHVTLNGTPLTFPVPPQVVHGRVLLPFRALFQALGAQVNWSPDNPDYATATRGSDTVSIEFGAFVAQINGHSEELPVPPMVVNGSSLVPLRFMAQDLGLKVQWDAATDTVLLTTAS